MIIIFYGVIAIAVFLCLLGILNPKIFWLAGLVWYVASFLGSWTTVGLYLLAFPFTIWTFALAHTLRFIKNIRHTAVCLAVGILLWIFSINAFDDYWLFYPLAHLLG